MRSIKKIFTSSSDKTNKLVEPDLKCILECKLLNGDKVSTILKNISGTKKLELLGSNVNEIDLNLLLTDKFRALHTKFIIDILKYKESSKFWDSFTNGKMSRQVNIINPLNKNTYEVKMKINKKSQNIYDCIFNVEMYDIKQVNTKYNRNIKTHELSSVIKSAINITSKIENSANNIQSDINNEILILKDLLTEAERLCYDTKKYFYDSNIITNEENTIYVKLYLELAKFIKNQKEIYNEIDFEWKIDTSVLIEIQQNNFIWKNITKIIKNIINFTDSNKINIIINELVELLDENNNEKKIYIIIDIYGSEFAEFISNDNYKIIKQIKISEQLDSFESDKIINNLISEKNKTFDGTIEICKNESLNDMKYKIKFLIEEINSSEFIIKQDHIKLLSSIKNKKKIILLVDDSLLNLKILCIKIIKYIDKNFTYKNFPILTNDEWQNLGIVLIETTVNSFILCANGLYGKEISMLLEPYIIITDIQMPLLNGIDMIKLILENNIRSKIIVNSAYVEKYDKQTENLIKDNNIQFIEKGTGFDWIESIYKII